jgi:very-short-patch-repair endonuclease
VFRRPVPLFRRSIADFVAPVQRLVIEIDGGYRAEQARRHGATLCLLAVGTGFEVGRGEQDRRLAAPDADSRAISAL